MTARFIQIGVPPSQIILKGLDLFTIIIAPALPIALTVGVIFAVNRLKNHQISCIVPSRFNWIQLFFNFHNFLINLIQSQCSWSC